ncbi:immunity protein SdpI [Shouchella clausii]|uniref:SdpI family protein n=1 Tax=Shouchella tritolerans TaxID=2979466 RepID=UPI000787FBA3|nr:SdpI family protein [Shouchella tritolerans]GIN12720.1 immunity protein SdpI [Shouchella clausii]
MKKHLFPLLAITISLLVWLFAYKHLPAEMPVHWGVNGEVDRYAPTFSAFLLLNGILIAIYAMLLFLPRLDPKKDNYNKFTRTYSIMCNVLIALSLAISIVTVLTGIGAPVSINRVVPVAIGILFIILGNYMQTIKPNWFVGIKTPWTISNDEVWRKTHRLGGRLFIGGGLLLIIEPFLPRSVSAVLSVGLIVVLVGVPMAYSYILHKRIVGH